MLLPRLPTWGCTNELLQQLVDATPTALIVLDQDFEVLQVNEAACELLGRTRVDLLGRPVLEAWASERLSAAVGDLLENARRGHGQVSVEGPVTGRDAERWARWSVSPLEGGGRSYLLLVGRDVTELHSLEQRRRADDALGRIAATCDSIGRAIPRLLRALCRTLGWDAGELWSVDTVAGVLRCDGLWAVTGYDLSTLAETCRSVSLRPGEGLPGTAWARGRVVQLETLGDAARVYRSGVETALSFPIRGRDEIFGVVTLSSRRARLLDAALLDTMESFGTQIGLLFDRIRVRENLRRTEGALRTVHEIGTRAEASLVSKLQALLHEGCRWFGTEVGSLIRAQAGALLPVTTVTSENDGRSWSRQELFDSPSSPLPCSPYPLEVLRRDACVCIERAANATRESAWPSFIGIPVRVRGEPYAVLGFSSSRARRRRFSATDREIVAVMAQWIGAELERDQLQEQLVEGERLAAIGMTAATFAHEVSNPLTNMALACEVVERDLSRPTGKPLARLELVKKEVARLARLLDEFRGLSRGQLLSVEPSCLFELVQSVMSDFRPMLLAGRVVHEVEGRSASCNIDRDKIRQVVMNLIKNALEAMPQGGVLSVRVDRTDSGVRLEVRDTGCGIPDHVDVFAPFATTKRDGTGLGLAVARQLVTAHRGHLTYETTAGCGTRFVVDLPRVRTREIEKIVPAPASCS